MNMLLKWVRIFLIELSGITISLPYFYIFTLSEVVVIVDTVATDQLQGKFGPINFSSTESVLHVFIRAVIELPCESSSPSPLTCAVHV